MDRVDVWASAQRRDGRQTFNIEWTSVCTAEAARTV